LDFHEGKKKYVCDHCGGRFSKRFNLTVHLKSVARKENKRLEKQRLKDEKEEKKK
jgi:hypothetical protein